MLYGRNRFRGDRNSGPEAGFDQVEFRNGDRRNVNCGCRFFSSIAVADFFAKGEFGGGYLNIQSGNVRKSILVEKVGDVVTCSFMCVVISQITERRHPF